MLQHYEFLVRFTKKVRSLFVVESLQRCRPLSFVRRVNTHLPCDDEDVDCLTSPLQSFCAEFLDGSPIGQVYNFDILCLMSYESYPTEWHNTILVYDKQQQRKYTVRSIDEQYKYFGPFVNVLWRLFVRRMNREFVVVFRERKFLSVPKTMVRMGSVWLPLQVITPYTNKTERVVELQGRAHKLPNWVRGTWLPCMAYGVNRDGDHVANWDWRVVDDNRVFRPGQLTGRGASYDKNKTWVKKPKVQVVDVDNLLIGGVGAVDAVDSDLPTSTK